MSTVVYKRGWHGVDLDGTLAQSGYGYDVIGHLYREW